MFGTLADDIVILAMAAVAVRLAVWLYKDVKRQQLQELQAAREAARAAEMLEIKQRIYAEITRSRTMKELKASRNTEGTVLLRSCEHSKNRPSVFLRKATGLFSDESAQALVQ